MKSLFKICFEFNDYLGSIGKLSSLTEEQLEKAYSEPNLSRRILESQYYSVCKNKVIHIEEDVSLKAFSTFNTYEECINEYKFSRIIFNYLPKDMKIERKNKIANLLAFIYTDKYKIDAMQDAYDDLIGMENYND